MTVVTLHQNDIDFTQRVFLGVEKMFQTKTSSAFINISSEHSTASRSMYAVHPIANTLVEINPEQAWFWSPEWLKGEMAVDEELRLGDFEEFDNIDDFINSL